MTPLTVVEGTTLPSGYCPCVVCIKNVFRHHQNAQETNSKLLQLFINLLERMSPSSLTCPKEVGLCNDCAVIVESATKLFHQIKCLQLHLDWNLDKVRRVMVLADMVPSRVRELQKMYKCDDTTTGALKQLRCSTKNKLEQYKATLFPKVNLHDFDKATSSSQRGSKDKVNSTPFKIIRTAPFISQQKQTQKIESEVLNFGLSWIVSFITITTLGTLFPKEGGAGVSTGTSEPIWDASHPCETADDDYCNMEVEECPENISIEDAEATAADHLTVSTVIPAQTPPVHFEKLEPLKLTLAIPVSPSSSETNVEDFKMECLQNDCNVENNEPEQDLNKSFETEKRLLRRQYKCSCLMTFSTLLRLEGHKKTCKTEGGKEVETEHDVVDSGDEEFKFQNENPRIKFEINESESSSEDENQFLPHSSDSEHHDDKNPDTAIKSLNETFECISCKASFQMDDIEFEKFRHLHNAYMHSNGQTILDQITVERLQISGADVTLDSAKFTKQLCSFPECKNLIFADTDSFDYHKSLHGAFKCDVCEFECFFAVQLAIHESEHSPKRVENISCPRCPFEANADYKYYNHFMEAHLHLKTQLTKCGVCFQTFLDLAVPLQHFVNEHDVSRLENASKVFICSKVGCNAYFLKRYQLHRHKTTHLLKMVKAVKTISSSSHLGYKCGICLLQFEKKRQLIIHRSIFHKSGTNSLGIRIISPEGVTINDIVHKINATWFCSADKCEEKFMTEAELETHYKLHGNFPCQFCSKVFEFAPDLSIHEKAHKQANILANKRRKIYKFSCSRCDYKTNFRNRYIHHYLETHLRLTPDQIKCPICHLSFYEKDEQNLKTSIFKHWNVSHNSASLEAGQCFMNCDICSAYFVSGLQLRSHKTKVHKIELNDCDKARNKRMHMCTITHCKKCFDSQEHLKSHLQTTHARKTLVRPVKVYKCKRCATVIKTPNYSMVMSCHNRYKHSDGQRVLSMSTIRTLNLTAANIKLTDSFTKQNCPHEGCERKVFVSQSSFNFHQSLHGDFTCNTCNFKCNFAIQLMNHELDHLTSLTSGQKGVTCPRCEMSPTDPVRHFIASHLKIGMTEISKCDICQFSFGDVEVPFSHYVNEHDLNRLDYVEGVVKCKEDKDNCFAYFLTDAQLQVHIQRIHTGGVGKRAATKFKCIQCLKQFNNHATLKNHQIIRHKRNVDYSSAKITSDGITIDDLINKINASYICSVNGCNESFFSEEDLKIHSKLHGKFCCSLCSVEKTFAPEIPLHALVHNSQNKQSNIKRYSCCLCEFKSVQKLKYVEHYLESHMGLSTDLVRCLICRQAFYCDSFGLKIALYYHFSVTHDLAALEPGTRIVNCDMCAAYFLTETQLSHHKKNIHGDKNNWKACIDCSKTFAHYGNLAKHRKKVHLVNENDFQFVCDVENCEEKFEFKVGLEFHKVFVHNNEGCATFKCPQCQKVYKQKPTFDLHVKNHGKPKQKLGPKKSPPVICEQCGQIFKLKYHLQRHKLRHVGPDGWEFVCDICSRKFAVKSHLVQHMRTHTKEKPFVCEVCGEKYAHRHNWRHHMKNKHNINIVARKVDSTNMKSTRKGKKLVKQASMPDTSESD